MARGDAAEEQRLDDGCTRGTYEQDDPAYRTRMHLSFTAAALACASIQRDLDVLTALHMVKDVCGLFRDRARETVETAFFCGWHAAREAAGADVHAEDAAVEAELAELRQDGVWPLDAAVRAVMRGAGRRRTVTLLSAWEGLSRFSRECCGIEPLVLTRAWRLVTEDPAAEALKLDPGAEVDEALAAEWHRNLSGPWAKHTDPYE
ncbi:MAG: hypothetical protein JWO31_1615 [Phycisphaerales bacterium]|nr:hypothetical protein [Phycisphaerales bacterium]